MDENAMGVLQEKGITRWVVEAGRRVQESGNQHKLRDVSQQALKK